MYGTVTIQNSSFYNNRGIFGGVLYTIRATLKYTTPT